MNVTVAARRASKSAVSHSTLADLLHRLGDVSPERVRSVPAPGTATAKDVVAAHAADNSLCELIDGTLVEKPVGFEESQIGMELGRFIGNYLRGRKLGVLAGADGMVKLNVNLVRIPDVSFVAKDDLPERKKLEQGMLPVAPTLAIEVLSPSNTKREMERKRMDYFRAGTKLVWEIDPKLRVVHVYTGPNKKRRLAEKDVLTAGKVLPGFELPLRELFSVLDDWT
jgi:Uma2 family endonuclease